MVPWVPAVGPRVTEKSAQPSTPHRSDWGHGPRIHHQSGPVTRSQSKIFWIVLWIFAALQLFVRCLNKSNRRMSIRPDIQVLRSDGVCCRMRFGCLFQNGLYRAMEKPTKKAETRKFIITNESGLHARPV